MKRYCEIIQDIKQALEDPNLDDKYKELLCEYGNYIIENLNCSNCDYEDFEFVSIGMLHYFCRLRLSLTTRSYDEVSSQAPIFPDECPMKKLNLKIDK